MKIIKSFFRNTDIFGVPFFFTYKNTYRYATPLGGFSFIVFCIGVFIVLIYKFIPFYNRKYFSIIDYTMSMSDTEQINLEESNLAFAVGLDCTEDKDGTKAVDLLDVELSFITYTKDNDGKRNKKIEILPSHPCRYEDFYNNFNHSFDYLNIKKLYCLDEKNRIIQGIYEDSIFTYYQFNVYSKENTEDNFNRIDEYLLRNDCKFQFYYIDISFDINNVTNPVQPYINSFFLQLSPILFLKTNIYFMNQYFIDDKLLFWDENGSPALQALFSRYESYSLYKGLNRYANQMKDYKSYGNIYVRADTQRNEIKRQYQKITEFYAGISSIFVFVYYVLCVIFYYINNFYAELSVSKKIFLFKELENNNIDFTKKNKKIKKLILLTEPIIKQMDKNKSVETNENMKNFTSLPKNNDIYKELKKDLKENKILSEGKEAKKEEIINYHLRLEKLYFPNKEGIKYRNNQKSSARDELSKGHLIDIPLENNNHITRAEKEQIDDKNNKKISFYFNLYEVIISSCLKCFMTKKMRLKYKLKSKATNFLYKRLDIVSYIRNLIIIELINHYLLDDNKKNIINFLSRPKLSINSKENKELDKFYDDYYDHDFEKLFYITSELAKNKYKIRKGKRLIYLINHDLKELL